MPKTVHFPPDEPNDLGFKEKKTNGLP
jgi:hypothetical protein